MSVVVGLLRELMLVLETGIDVKHEGQPVQRHMKLMDEM